MSFLKIRDPLKREQTIKEYLELKKRIHDNQLAEKEGRLKYQQQLSRFFRPVIESQKETSKNISKESGFNRISRLTTKLDEFPTLKVFVPLLLNDEEEEEIANFFDLLDLKGLDDNISKIFVSPNELSQLKRFKNKDDVDTTYGLYEKDEKLFIGDKKIDIANDNFYIDNNEFKGTPGLWELIVAKEPDENKYTKEDKENYKKIILESNTLHKDNNPKINIPKDKRMNKWKNILRFFWFVKSYYPFSGRGITIIPSDPNALLERLDLLMASKGAGNTGVRNELVSICDELKRQHVLDTKAYKKLMSKI